MTISVTRNITVKPDLTPFPMDGLICVNCPAALAINKAFRLPPGTVSTSESIIASNGEPFTPIFVSRRPPPKLSQWIYDVDSVTTWHAEEGNPAMRHPRLLRDGLKLPAPIRVKLTLKFWEDGELNDNYVNPVRWVSA